ncbi:hypothetical protein [Psychrobacter sp.]|uniref:hypothetical protein n=1 Tax=Psychrobacter sp. TaxID=56811 RepID=UPI002649A044|nr:hypothetical protein [Psychrobacter sp.]MDN6308384.1 hypothetical protein [Psychrobacter sp.]
MTSKIKQAFLSTTLLKLCFYLFCILFVLSPIVYIYDANGFDFTNVKSLAFSLATFYTFALIGYIEIQRDKQPNNKPFSPVLILISQLFLGILFALFSVSAITYIRGNLALDQIYDPVLQFFFVYLIAKSITEMKNGLENTEETTAPSSCS